jgi:hypothetical protein
MQVRASAFQACQNVICSPKAFDWPSLDVYANIAKYHEVLDLRQELCDISLYRKLKVTRIPSVWRL